MPTPGDVLLLIEVAESSLEYDRKVQLALYASGGITEVWILNLADQLVEVSSDLSAREYRHHAALGADTTLSPRALPDVTIRVASILP